MNIKRMALVAPAVILVLSALAGCSMAYGGSSSVKPVVSQNFADSDSVLNRLSEGSKITINKSPISLNDSYSVKTGDLKLGEIRGQYIHVLGNTYSFFSEAGNLVASEGEGYRVITHNSSLYDYTNKPSGAINEEISLLLTKWSIYNKDKVKIGYAQENLSFTLDFTVKNAKGVDEYRITKSLISFGAELTITKLTSETSVPAIDAVWLAVIANKIAEAKKSEDSSKKDSSKKH